MECSDGRRGNSFKLEEARFRLDIKKRFFTQGVEALEQLPQRSCGCPILESIQGQAGWSFVRTDLVESIPACGRRVGIGRSLRYFPSQTIL